MYFILFALLKAVSFSLSFIAFLSVCLLLLHSISGVGRRLSGVFRPLFSSLLILRVGMIVHCLSLDFNNRSMRVNKIDRVENVDEIPFFNNNRYPGEPSDALGVTRGRSGDLRERQFWVSLVWKLLAQQAGLVK